MTFERLDSIVARVVSRVRIDGEEAIAVASDAVLLKEPASTEVPAVVGQEVVSRDTALPAKEDYASRHRHTGADGPNAAKGSPARPVCLCLVVSNEGDGPAWVEGGRAPGRRRRNAGEGSRAGELVKLVVG